jgi:NAD(P)H-hydrate repair Nnr-like enzyme with NAD(P)H-hydrate dehydratase domain
MLTCLRAPVSKQLWVLLLLQQRVKLTAGQGDCLMLLLATRAQQAPVATLVLLGAWCHAAAHVGGQ